MSFERLKEYLGDLLVNYRPFVVILSPILLLPVILCIRTPASDCGYVVLLMVIFWVTDAIPLPVTGLLPIVLFPLIGIMSAQKVAQEYITDISLLLLGGILTAMAVERSDFHRRLALRVLLTVGTKPISILLGMMLPTWFLSMWISNTAAAAMMLPISKAVVEQIGEGVRVHQANSKKSVRSDEVNHVIHEKKQKHDSKLYGSSHHDDDLHDDENSVAMDILDNGLAESSEPIDVSPAKDLSKVDETPLTVVEEAESSEPVDTSVAKDVSKVDDTPLTVVEEAELQKRLSNFGKMLNLAVAYSATVGGTATLTGSPPNLIFQKLLNAFYEDYGLPPPVNFLTWFCFGLPHAILCFVVTLLCLQVIYLGWRSFCFCCVKDHESDDSSEGIRTVIRSEYDSLGPMRFAEYAACVLFVLLVILWFLRDPGIFKGYGNLFKEGFVTDGVPAIFIAILMFVFPSDVPRMFCLRRKGEPSQRIKPLLEWEYVSIRFPWGVIIILGGGFALAEGFEDSGLSHVIGSQLQTLSSLPPWVMILVVVFVIAILTEVTSNTAVAIIVIPILCQMALTTNVNPLYLTLPATMGASYAFLLPVATPVNALVFSYGNLTVPDMVKAGLVLNVVCVLVVTVGIHTWGRLVFDLDLLPWKNYTTTTIAPP